MFNPVTTLTVQAGMAETTGPTGNHIIVYDQLTRMLPVTEITWVLGPALTGVVVTPDSTGFFFTAPANSPAESDVATATYTVNGVTGHLTVNVVVEAVTALQFSQE